MKISILDDYQDVVRTLNCFSKLAEHQVAIWNDHTKNVDTLTERLGDTEVLVLNRERTPVRAELVERLPKLRLIVQRGAFPNIDVQACTRQKILVCSTGSANRPSYATAEFTWGLILATLRHIPQEVARLKAGQWQGTVGSLLRGKTLGIFSYGRIGALIAGYGKAFGMKILVWGRSKSLERARADGHNAAPSKAAFFEQSDIVTLHLRLVPETHGIVSVDDLARMKPTALLVNTSRAGLIAEGALESALHSGRPGMAAIDVFRQEPLLDTSHPLLQLSNVVCTPHLGYVEREELEDHYSGIFDRIFDYFARRALNAVNPEADARR